ncbi:hypothetical protein EUTSA_v10017517mg [Eutrema salsugineum]|uniref:TF-B3 domain-containing protein n=1 Tax=Eutrema salsugineum TaxID=72664 RepID=V4LQ63_EUTSA|nr:putative B3 domain-containing protein At4g03170 [Eutrema salsugineum]ESQ52715.1 hypothetical protein EUTSA_v10017517mg [Eutrema salsugineum]
MATPTKETTSYTPEDIEAAYILLQLSRDYREQAQEEEEEDAIKDEVPSIPIVQQVSQTTRKLCTNRKTLEKKQKTTINKKSKKIKKKYTSRKFVEKDDSEETRNRLMAWNQTELDPGEIFRVADVAEWLGKPIKKQMSESDVKVGQNRLMLGKEKVKKWLFPRLKKTEIPSGTRWLDVSVYGPDGNAREMKFKMWSVDTPVLSSGWREFFTDYGFQMHCDILTIRMFRHLITRKICFAIHKTRFPSITKPLSDRIVKDVFPNPT